MSDSLRPKPLHIIFILISGVVWGTIGLYTTALGKIGLDSVSVTAGDFSPLYRPKALSSPLARPLGLLRHGGCQLFLFQHLLFSVHAV